MFKMILISVALVPALASASLNAQSSEHKAKHEPFTFRQGQSVYIAAFHHEESPRQSAFGQIVIGENLAAQGRIRKEFEKWQAFKIVDRLTEADFVFVIYIHDSAAEGLAIAPENYNLFKEDLYKSDLVSSREAAYGRFLVGPYKIPTLGKISTQLVRKFQAETKINIKIKL
jgi:hypothetical protein